jgi:hypothetical protein
MGYTLSVRAKLRECVQRGQNGEGLMLVTRSKRNVLNRSRMGSKLRRLFEAARNARLCTYNEYDLITVLRYGSLDHSENLPWPPGRVFDALGQGIFSITVSVSPVSVLAERHRPTTRG